MRTLLGMLLLGFLWQCQDPAAFDWKATTYEGPLCAQCPQVTIALPEGPEGNPLAEAVHRVQAEEVIAWLDYRETNSAATIEEAISGFGESYRELAAAFPEETMGWEATIEGLVQYESAALLTLSLDGYVFTGGAHGLSHRILLNFDKGRAEELDAEDLLLDPAGFRELAESAFRATYGIGAEAPINSTGFMFEGDRFHLPENFGFLPEGVLLYYNPYEVASFADGPLEVLIPFDQAIPYLTEAYRPQPNP
ncbi:DUF3298 domain-containing protein [Robiginitalea sp. M366]|uniref:DUF3298 and DUF4163 domain-containing protein n=1 Tax=Robiginitalea aestuariiviva TaxID=3036903 RepID=UPI00240E7D4D|nr:DUF3298 and DUF4163 domain-containing protein [Robiginitalea aestuariiviva]MDG1571655.1 DUF3298 domain-containing protein [Robiginitalea aestuariiviva]